MTTSARPDMKRIVVPFEVKDFDAATRTFRGLAATWDLDLGGDVIEKGAFKRTIGGIMKAKGKRHPLLDSHDHQTIFSVLGGLNDAAETDAGVDSQWEFRDTPRSQEAADLVKGGYVTSLSIGYEPVVTKAPNQDETKRGIWRYIKELKWLETSLVLFPMNPAAAIDLATVKGILADGHGITPEQREALQDAEREIRALLEKTAPPLGDPAPLGLAPDDPIRLALEQRVRGLKLRSLGIGT